MSSDWGDFCESKGMNPGSEKDYRSWVNSLHEDEPVERPSKPIPTEEIEPSLSKEELLGLIVDDLSKNQLDLLIEEQVGCDHDGYELKYLDRHLDEPEPNISIRIAYEHQVPITFFIDVLRTHRVPVLQGGDWLAWDERNKCLRLSSPPLTWLWSKAIDAERLRRMARHSFSNPTPAQPQTVDEARLELLLHRALLSTDHATKPMLVHRDFLDDALCRREFEFEETRRIHRGDLKQFFLAYYDSAGTPISTPLSAAAELGLPVTTRTGAYIWTSAGDLDPVLNTDAQMVAGAFAIATRWPSEKLTWFSLRDRGTLFQAPIERIEPPVEVFGSTLQSALIAGQAIQQAASEMESVYLTTGGHPLSSDPVTTPALYLHAVQTLHRMHHEVDYISKR